MYNFIGYIVNMGVFRVIEIYDKMSEKNISTIHLGISSHEILTLLVDLVLNFDDYPEELYDPYFLDERQVLILLDYIGKMIM